MTTRVFIGVRIPEGDASTLEQLCAHTSKRRSDVVRDAINFYATGILDRDEIDKRRQVTFEFLYLVADRLLSESSPDLYNKLVSEAQRRAEALYAAS